MSVNKQESFIRLPKSITVKGAKYKIILEDDLRDDDGRPCVGLHDHEKKVIHIDKKLSSSDKRQTFLHELFHAYFYELHIREGVDSQLEEVIVESLSQAIEKTFIINWKRHKV